MIKNGSLFGGPLLFMLVKVYIYYLISINY